MESLEIKKSLVSTYLKEFPSEGAKIFNSVPENEILPYLKTLPLAVTGKILLDMSSDVSAEVLGSMDDDLFSSLFPILDSYKGAILMSRLNKHLADEKLKLLPTKLSSEILELMTYPPGSAGFIMDTRITTFRDTNTVSEVLDKIRTLQDRRILNIYVVEKEDRLLGAVSLQVIATSAPDEILKNVIEKVVSVHVMSPTEEVVEILEDRKILSLPVLDLDDTLLGIIRYDALITATQVNATEDVQAIFGAGREERALSKVNFAIKKRLPWLEINLATAFLAASVVGLFEETIAQITVLAVFLPVVAGQSGNTGSQALAVTIRGLALREIRTSQWWKVARKEVAVGFFNGVIVALTTAIIVYFWASSIGLAMVIGVSMIFSMVLAGFSGAIIPIMLKSIGQDPAQSSSIVLTTVTDVVGFLSFLGLATLLQSMIGIG